MKIETDVVIVGAGAAGLMCAIEAGKRGRRVLLLDHAKAVGDKIRISGGGRCNFTNLHTAPDNFLSANPHFCKSALARYQPADFIALVEAHGIAWYEKTLGQLFCVDSAKQIIDMLVGACSKAGVDLRLNTSVTNIEKTSGKTNDGFRLETSLGDIDCASLVIACGGKSIPKMGATGFGYDVARQFGLEVIQPRPALVPLTFDAGAMARYAPLAGLSLDVAVRTSVGKNARKKQAEFREALLFTHRGISGPAILQISSYWREGDDITIDLAPDCDVLALLRQARDAGSKQSVAGFLSQELPTPLPKRLARHIATELGVGQDMKGGQKLAELSDARLAAIAAGVNNWVLTPQGSEGFRKAEVTVGGVDTNALSSKTFAVKKLPGLFFIGEVVDVTGHLGGHNFQWAWASGHAAGQVI